MIGKSNRHTKQIHEKKQRAATASETVSEEMIGKKNRHTIAEKSSAPPARAQGVISG
jgi:hypothetical protein